MEIIQLNLARNCLRYAIRAYGIKEIWCPYYICPCVWHAITAENCKINLYHINENFYPDIEFGENDFILYPNYFGICTKNVISLAEKYKNLIVDNSHSFYSKPMGLASFTSLRKFFNVPNGAYLYTEKILTENFETDVLKKTPTNFDEFLKNEKFLDNEYIKLISPEIKIKDDAKIRREKFDILHEKYKSSNLLDIKIADDDVPFVYPYLTMDDEFVKTLDGDILRYWSPIPKHYSEYNFYRHLVPIPLT